jgi:hypothetical protein
MNRHGTAFILLQMNIKINQSNFDYMDQELNVLLSVNYLKI